MQTVLLIVHPLHLCRLNLNNRLLFILSFCPSHSVGLTLDRHLLFDGVPNFRVTVSLISKQTTPIWKVISEVKEIKAGAPRQTPCGTQLNIYPETIPDS